MLEFHIFLEGRFHPQKHRFKTKKYPILKLFGKHIKMLAWSDPRQKTTTDTKGTSPVKIKLHFHTASVFPGSWPPGTPGLFQAKRPSRIHLPTG